MMSNVNVSHGKMPDFVLFPLFGFTLVRKLRNDFFIIDRTRHFLRILSLKVLL